MCLEFVREPEEKAGYGYKFVRQTPYLSAFLPEWERFNVGGAGTHGDYEDLIPNRAFYGLFNTFTIPYNTPFTRSFRTEEKYLAGVHLYKKIPSWARCRYHDGMAVIRCHYNKAIAEDDNVVVAREVTPVAVVARGPGQ